MSERKRWLTYRERPVAYVCACAVLIVGILTLLYLTGVEWFQRGEWSWLFGVALSVVVGWWLFAMQRVVREVVRTLRDEPQKSKKRADLWRGARVVLFVLATAAFVVSALYVLGAVWTWRSAPTPADYAGQSAEMKSAMERLRTEALREAGDWAMRAGFWLLASAAAIWGARGVRRQIRRAEGKCVRCGYMLRGLPEPRCPECGTAFNPADLEEDRARQESAPGDRPGG